MTGQSREGLIQLEFKNYVAKETTGESPVVADGSRKDGGREAGFIELEGGRPVVQPGCRVVEDDGVGLSVAADGDAGKRLVFCGRARGVVVSFLGKVSNGEELKPSPRVWFVAMEEFEWRGEFATEMAWNLV